MKILLSIKPPYVKNILNQKKRFEYRKTSPQRDIDTIVIYSTYPDMKVVGEVKVIELLSDTPENLWKLTQQYAGISNKAYMNYFSNKKIAYAYKLGDVLIFDTPKTLADYGLNQAPQSFVYL